MKINTLLNIYQSYELTKISALNKQNLIALYAQNEQLNKLNNELARSNRTTEQILRNQIKEIERQEKCRYYKDVSFNLSQAITILENETNTNFRIFASTLFLPIIRDMAKEAVQGLEEIADKEYANKILQRCISLSENDKSNIVDYQSTSWAQMLPTRKEVEKLVTKEIVNKEKELQHAIKEKEEKHKDANLNSKSYKGCFVVMSIITGFILLAVIMTIVQKDFESLKGGIIVLFFSILFLGISYRAKKSDKGGLSENADETLQAKIESLDDELSNLKKKEYELNAKCNDILQDVTVDCPKWETKLNEISNLLPLKNLGEK